MKINNKVSIIIPTYNRDIFLARSIRSALSQRDAGSYDVIVVDDGSTDNTSIILELFKDEIIIVKNNNNIGLSKSLNKALSIVKTQYFVRLDSDDYLSNHFLYQMLFFANSNPEIDAFSSDYYLTDDIGQILEKKDSSSFPIGCGILFKTDDIRSIGSYNEKLKIHEEKDLRVRFDKKYSIHRVALPLYRYRKHDNNLTNNKKLFNLGLKYIER